MGESGFNYSVGFLRYREAQSGGGGNNSDLLLVIIPALAGLAVLVLTILAVLCCFAAVSIRRKRTYKIKQRYFVYLCILFLLSFSLEGQVSNERSHPIYIRR